MSLKTKKILKKETKQLLEHGWTLMQPHVEDKEAVRMLLAMDVNEVAYHTHPRLLKLPPPHHHHHIPLDPMMMALSAKYGWTVPCHPLLIRLQASLPPSVDPVHGRLLVLLP
jgi:hypothetical protein